MKKLFYGVPQICLAILLALHADAQLSRNNTKTSVPWYDNYQRIAAGQDHSLELRNGTLWAWGGNSVGELGLGNTTDHTSPVQVGIENNWVNIEAGAGFSLGLRSDGTLWSWGSNSDGQLGIGVATIQLSPVLVGSNYIAISAGFSFVMAIKSDGSLWTWGINNYGQLGNGNTGSQNTPQRIGTDNDWISVSAGGFHSLALKSDGTLWSWGLNFYGELGIGNNTDQHVPVQVTMPAGVRITGMSAGGGHSLARTSAGELYSWGWNFYGQLGTGNTTDQNSPVHIPSSAFFSRGVGTVQAGADNSFVTTNRFGVLYAWGHNQKGQLGIGNTIDQLVPATLVPAFDNCMGISTSKTIFSYHTLGVKADGTVWSFGDNVSGQLGIGNNIGQLSPVKVSTVQEWINVSGGGDNSIGLKSDGTGWTWGKNDLGQAGIGNYSAQKSPAETTINPTVRYFSVAPGKFHCLVRTNLGDIYSWGDNSTGRLGDGTTTSQTTPVIASLGALFGFKSIATGLGSSYATSGQGFLYAWGDNTYGQLGIGNTLQQNSPAHIGLFTEHWVSLASGSGGNHMLAIKDDGTLWAWGYNIGGQLGIGNNINQLSPVQVGTDNDWIAVSRDATQTYALKSNGTLWAWGANAVGELGTGTLLSSNVPLQIGSDHDWIRIGAGFLFGYAQKGNGTVWSWGYNANGQLGVGHTANLISPAQVPGSNTWVQISPSSTAHVLGLKADRDIICGAGDNSFASFGNDDNTSSLVFSCGPSNCANYSISGSNLSHTREVSGINYRTDFQTSCTLIASLTAFGANPVTGSAEGRVWIEPSVPFYGGQPFVARHYQITPASNPTTAMGTIILYFTQAEFDAFNAAPGSVLDLPTDPNDATGISHLRVAQYPGSSNDGTGLPGSYAGGASIIDPTDANIVWDAFNNRWSVRFSVIGFSGFIVQTSVTVLPLRLTAFTGKLKNTQTELRWKTANEDNTSYFEIERGIDGSSFSTIGKKPAVGRGDNNYTTFDEHPLQGKNYYRLRMVDKDGQFTYSEIILVNVSGGGSIAMSLYPNPADKILTVKLDGFNKPAQMSMYSSTGARVLSGTLLPTTTSFNIEKLPSGIYTVQILYEGEIITQKLVKQ